MNKELEKVREIFESPALKMIWRWSKPVHVPMFIVSSISVVSSLASLGMTLVTKNLIDGATGRDISALWYWGATLTVLIVLERLLSIASSAITLRTSTRFQMEMQRSVTAALIGKEYAGLKPYHSGELVNRVFSDVGVVRNGILSLMPSILRTVVSFVGAAVILIGVKRLSDGHTAYIDGEYIKK